MHLNSYFVKLVATPAIARCAVIGDKVSYHPCHVKILSLPSLVDGTEMLPIKAVPCSEL